MNVKASAGGRYKDIRDNVYKLTLTSDIVEETQELARILRELKSTDFDFSKLNITLK